ncbi:MAG TPA: SurA N-terminal domain-containing protein [Blastocatellia bacterium]|nr:SurA N-terminal domain-containing protein [Blastocatellia bacterium]
MKTNHYFSTITAQAVKRVSTAFPARTSRSAAPMSILIFIVLAFAASCKKSESENVAARVGTHDITIKEVDSAIKQQLDSNGTSNAPLTPAELVAAQLTTLNNLIQTEALFEKAEQEKLVPDDTKVTEAIQTRKHDSKLTEDEYQKQLRQADLTETVLRDQVKRELAITALRDKEKARVQAPTEDDIRKYYSDHKADFVATRGADISIISTDPANNNSTDDAIGDAAAQEKITAIYQQLKTGADFATIASQRSEDPATAVRGGELGFVTEDQLKQGFPTRPDIPPMLMGMNPGQYTEPIRDNVSKRWYIFKLNNKREQPENLTLDTVRQDIVDKITQQRQQVLLNALIMVALAETTVKNYLADRIVSNPDTITMVKPSKLLELNKPPDQPEPHIENENASSPQTPSGGDASASSNRRRSSNANK